jgi:fibronectin-binding autotransporter adhesin
LIHFIQAVMENRSRSISSKTNRRIFLFAQLLVSPTMACAASAQQVVIIGDSNPADPAAVDGAVELEIGLNGAGALSILNGGTLTSSTLYLGRNTGGDGTGLVSGDDGSGNFSELIGTDYLYVGYDGMGALTIENGGVVTDTRGYIGYGSGSIGIVEVSGQGSRWVNQGDVVVGEFGDGTLDILDGGYVEGETGFIGASPGGVGVVNVSGDDGAGNASIWALQYDLNVGEQGTGTLNITQGGHVETGGRINVGSSGQGNVVLSDAASLSSNDAIVGVSDQGEALLTSGAGWTNSGQFTVGLQAQGTVRIEDGASLSSIQGYVGANAGGDGTVTVTGAGSSWTITGFNLSLGNYGLGTMVIEDGGRVSVNRSVDLGISDVAASGTLTVLGTPGARGVLETTGLRGGLGTAHVTLDGGVLRAAGNNATFFSNFGTQTATLGAAGGIIDTNGYSIGINPELTGAGSLTKEGPGTLTLTGANSYGGGTTIATGTLRLGNGGASGSIVGNVANSGILAFNRSDVVSFGNTVTGTGGVHQVGTGQTTLTADNSGLSGVSGVYSGILSVNGTLGGSMEVVGGRLQGTGQVGTTTNFASGTVAPGNSIGTLTVAGNYLGSGGTLEIEAVLGDDSSATDRLVVTGDTSGTTNVRVINLGGSGGQTTEGIKIVDVGGVSAGNFALLGNYTFEGAPAVVAGAYAYRLYQGGASTPADGDWYLRSALTNTGIPAGPLYQAGAPIYEAYSTVLSSFNAIETMQQRLGNRSWLAGVLDSGALPPEAGAMTGVWGRIVGRHVSMSPQFSTTGADFNAGMWQWQVGADQEFFSSESGRLLGSLSARYGTIAADITSVFGNGSISSSGYGLDGSLTWYGSEGFYLDGQADLSLYHSILASSTAATTLASGNGGFGHRLGLEAGQRIAIDSRWSVTPQAQFSYSGTTFDQFNDTYGASVSPTEGNDLTMRVGLSADYQNAWTNETGETNRLHAYGIANLYYDFRPDSRTDLSGVALVSTQESLWGGLGLGGTYSWGDERYVVHGQVGLNTSLTNFGNSYAVSGTAALAHKF